MQGEIRTGIRWIAVVLMAGLALLEVVALVLGTFTLNPEPPGLPMVCLLAIAQLVAVCLAFRIRWLPLPAGIASWIAGLVVFQIGEQHATLMNALKNTSLSYAFIFLAAVFWAIPPPQHKTPALPPEEDSSLPEA